MIQLKITLRTIKHVSESVMNLCLECASLYPQYLESFLVNSFLPEQYLEKFLHALERRVRIMLFVE